MKKIIALILIVCSFELRSQALLPVIKATSAQVSIRDGIVFEKNNWTLSPQAKPDVYTCNRTRQTVSVVFYTDIDSIKVKIKPGDYFDFVILLNEKDSCYTRIKSAITTPDNPTKNKKVTRDTVAFALTPYNAIAVKSIINNRDTVLLHFDAGSFDIRLTKDAILNKTGLLTQRADIMAGKAKADYRNMEKVFKVSIGKLVFENPEVVPTGITSTGMDGRFGWNIFEGKTVEINYDKNIIVIHSQMPLNIKGYTKAPIKFTRSFVCVNGSFLFGKKDLKGLFLLDTGSDEAIILDSGWVNHSGFPKDLKVIKTSSLKDPRGNVYVNKIVQVPCFNLNGFNSNNVPCNMLVTGNPTGFELNFLGNDLLKRYNVFMDFKTDMFYLKPNSLFNLPYRN